MNFELKEGELICPVCKGSGIDKEGIYVCNKCDGTKKVDWISNVTTSKKRLSVYRRIDIQRLILHIRRIVENNILETYFNIYEMIENCLDTCKSQRLIYDYKIEAKKVKEFDIFIKPSVSIETINLKISINEM